MLKNLLLAACLLPMFSLSAQDCGNPQAQTDLHGNNILARILNGGDLFWNHSDARFIPNPAPGGLGPSSIFNAGLWLGGLDGGGNLDLAAVTYHNTTKTDFFAGPISTTDVTDAATCSHWDRLFKVRADRIAAFLLALPVLSNDPGLAAAQYPDIMGWPASGNPYFADIAGFELPANGLPLAPFRDTDLDGLYNPLQGDYPAVGLRLHEPFVPTEMVWCVFNDQGAGAIHSATGGKTFPVEVQLTAWAFDSITQPLLGLTLFTSHKLIFHTAEPVDSCFVGMWVDFDLGCGADDYVGSAPALNAFFAYNQDPIDGNTGNTCTGIGFTPTFPAIPPIQSTTFLNLSLDKCMHFNNPSANPPPPVATTDPDQAIEYYRYLTGHWRDGMPLTYGGSGYGGGTETNYAFPDPPSDPSGWSMCTENLQQSDRRMIGVHQLGQVLPGQITELDVAWTVHPNPDLPCGLGTTFSDISAIKNLFDNNFVTATTTPWLEASIVLSPNPATNTVAISYGPLPVLELRCFDAAGRLVRRVEELPASVYSMDLTGWQPGTYILQILSRKGMVARPLVILR